MPNDDWGQDLPSGPAPKAEPDSPSEGQQPANAASAPKWTAPSFGPKPAVPAPSTTSAPREVTLDKPNPLAAASTSPPGEVSVPSTPYPPITESFTSVKAEETKSSSRRATTLIYGTPPIQDAPGPVGPPPASDDAARPSLADDDSDAHSFANDDADTILNPASPAFEKSSEHPAGEAAAPPASASSSSADPKSFSDDDDLIPSRTHHVPGHAQTEVDSHPAGLHSAPTEEAATPSTLPSAGPAVGAPIPEFDDETEQNPPSVSAEFFGNDASGAMANGPPGPSESAAFFASPGASPSDAPAREEEAATTTNAPVVDPAVAVAARAESTERIDRTAPTGAPLGGFDDDEDLEAVVQRSKRNTLIAAAVVLFLIVGSVAGAVALGVFDQAPEQVAKGAGRDITKDPRRELYTTDKPASASEDAAKASEPDVDTKAAAASAKEPSPPTPPAKKQAESNKDDGESETAPPTKVAQQKSKAPPTETDRENGALHDEAGEEKKATETKPERETSDSKSRRRSRSRARKTSVAASKSEPEQTPPIEKATTTLSIPVKAPGHIRWRTLAGKELGRGNATLTAAAGTTTIVAYDPRRGVKTKAAVPNGKTIDYHALPSGTLEIRVFPFADVYLGKEKIGTTPFAPLQLVAGTYKLKLKNGAKTRTESVTIRPGKISRVKVNLNTP